MEIYYLPEGLPMITRAPSETFRSVYMKLRMCQIVHCIPFPSSTSVQIIKLHLSKIWRNASVNEDTYIYNHHHHLQEYNHKCHHHHTVKVAMCAYSFVCTLVNVLVLLEKTPPAEVAMGDDHHECKWSICIIVDGRKTPPAQVAQCLDHLGHKYRSGMQQPNAACTRALL